MRSRLYTNAPTSCTSWPPARGEGGNTLHGWSKAPAWPSFHATGGRGGGAWPSSTGRSCRVGVRAGTTDRRRNPSRTSGPARSFPRRVNGVWPGGSGRCACASPVSRSTGLRPARPGCAPRRQRRRFQGVGGVRASRSCPPAVRKSLGRRRASPRWTAASAFGVGKGQAPGGRARGGSIEGRSGEFLERQNPLDPGGGTSRGRPGPARGRAAGARAAARPAPGPRPSPPGRRAAQRHAGRPKSSGSGRTPGPPAPCPCRGSREGRGGPPSARPPAWPGAAPRLCR
jgi:hypothetical protein